MAVNTFRITNETLIKLIPQEDLIRFYYVQSDLSLNKKQYFELSSLEQIVWSEGTDATYSKKLNKIASSLPLYTPPNQTLSGEKKYSILRVLLKQGFVWDNIFGLHLLIKDSKTEEVLISQIIKQNDFYITENRELVNGVFWLEEYICKIPTISNVLSCQITTVTFNDVSNITGLIYNYPIKDLIPLIEEKPIPDYIKNLVTFDENQLLDIQIVTDENKTVEQSILDYFELDFAQINISHVITFGTPDLGYDVIRVTNENNKYLSVTIGLNLTKYLVDIIGVVTINVQTNIEVDNKLMIRESTLQTDLSQINPLIVAQIEHPTTNFPVTVQKDTIINQTIIETKETKKIIGVYQPLFAELIKTEFIFEPKNISFTNLLIPAYLKLIKTEKDVEQIILSKSTSDNKIYFDLTEFNTIILETTYELIEVNTLKIIGKGNVFLKN